MPKALLRGVPDSYRLAMTGERGRVPDVALAREQHEVYRSELETAGYLVHVLAPDEAHPDCVFVEDTAVVLGSEAVIARPGEPSRRGEIDEVARALAEDLELRHIESPGTLDGGDVMVLGGRAWIGLSRRTNAAGAAQLARFAAEAGISVKEVPVGGVLHLKSGVVPVGDDTVVVTPGTVAEGDLEQLGVVHEHPDERHDFSALPLGAGRVLVTSAAPRTAERVAALGFEVVPIDVSEILAADGGLTCLSIIY